MNKNIIIGIAIIAILALGIGGGVYLSNQNKGEIVNKVDKINLNEDLLNEKNPVATITVKDYGTMTFQLFPEQAPESVNNFISLANSGFYKDISIHRIVKNFVVQGGDPTGTGTGGPGYSIKGEFQSNGFENSIKHGFGALSWARSQSPDSAGSQFFIVTGNAATLDGSYAGFGQLIEGDDVLMKLNDVKVKEGDYPKTDIIIENISVDTKGIEYTQPNKI